MNEMTKISYAQHAYSDGAKTALARRPSTVTNRADPSRVSPIPVLGCRSCGSSPWDVATIRP